jgi:hypothetical protein
VAQRIRKKGDVKAVFVVNDSSELLGTIPLHVIFEQQNDVKAEAVMLPCFECDHLDDVTSIIARLDPEDNLAWLPVRLNTKIVGAIPVSVLLWGCKNMYCKPLYKKHRQLKKTCLHLFPVPPNYVRFGYALI